jgi:hypothetical protein
MWNRIIVLIESKKEGRSVNQISLDFITVITIR